MAQTQDADAKIAIQPKTMTVEEHDRRTAFGVYQDGKRVQLVERGTMKVGYIER